MELYSVLYFVYIRFEEPFAQRLFVAVQLVHNRRMHMASVFVRMLSGFIHRQLDFLWLWPPTDISEYLQVSLDIYKYL